jgi:hypothetical protein
MQVGAANVIVAAAQLQPTFGRELLERHDLLNVVCREILNDATNIEVCGSCHPARREALRTLGGGHAHALTL